jgi:hypothetical protein
MKNIKKTKEYQDLTRDTTRPFIYICDMWREILQKPSLSPNIIIRHWCDYDVGS